MAQTYAGWLARTMPELGGREIKAIAAENFWHEDGAGFVGLVGREPEHGAAAYVAELEAERGFAAAAIVARAEDAEWDRMLRATGVVADRPYSSGL